VSKSQKFGIDCGATKIMAQSVIYDSKSKIIKPAGLNFEYSYSDYSFWDPDFIPTPLEIQKTELENGVFDIKKTERTQASAIVKIIKQLVSKLKSKDIALCYPGLKSRSGIILMVNGPRIPDLMDQIPELKTIYHDSECCLLGEINSNVGRIKHSKNTIYIGGGTGIADGIILNNEIIDFNKEDDLRRSWEIFLPSKMTVESNLSPNGMLAKWNRSSSKILKTLFELEEESKSKPIFEEASDAFSFLIRERISFFNRHNTQIEKIVIGQRLGEFLELCQKNIRLLFESKTNIPIEYSSDRRTASLGAAWKKFCS